MADDLTFDTSWSSASSDAEQQVRNALAWQEPRLPRLDSSIPRWAGAVSWSPPGTIPLVRHRAIGGERRIVTNHRHPPHGYEIEYDLGAVHQHHQSGTVRLLASRESFSTTRFEGRPADDLTALGWLEEAPLPMTQGLELRRLSEAGGLVLVAGRDDPLRQGSTFVGLVGFLEAFPILPRTRAESSPGTRFGVLTRTTDPATWRHGYSITAPSASAAGLAEHVVGLGGVSTSARPGYAELRRQADGTLASTLLSPPLAGSSLPASFKWAFAPLRWSDGPLPRRWAIAAAAGRIRRLRAGVAKQALAFEQPVLGYLRQEAAPGWGALYTAHHPVLPDQFVTRSPLEATDLGYIVDGILGHVLLRFGSDHLPRPREIAWASRFGHARRYAEPRSD